MSIWDNLIVAPGSGISLRVLSDSHKFQDFVNKTPGLLPKSLNEKKLDLDSLMEVQGVIITALSDEVASSEMRQKLRTIAAGIQLQGTSKSQALQDLGISPHHYCLGCGMLPQEIKAMEQGRYTVEEYLQSRPGVFLSPLLEKFVTLQ